MPSLSGVGWTVFSLVVLWRRTAVQSVGMRCSVAGPVGEFHPVQALLEKFEAGPGCAARESGNKETHVIAVGRGTNGPENKVTVLLKPFSLKPLRIRTVHLLLSSKFPITWWLKAERLSPNLTVLVQLSSNSSVQSRSLHLRVQTMHSLPFHPRALHNWALKHHGHLSSLTHTRRCNRVYVSLGEDPTLPAVCQLQSMFLSHNYMTSDLQQQEVQGCSEVPAGGISPEVHVIKLHSVGSGLCGSLQVEVVVSLVPLVANSKSYKVVLILSSSVPVNWAINARGVRGHIFVHSSNSVSPPYPPEPGLTLSSKLNADLSTISDLLMWVSESSYTEVTSYTEADLANRFVIQLAGGGTDVAAVINPHVVKPPWAEERRLRQWLNSGGSAAGGESFTVQCEDGLLSVTMDQRFLQSMSVPVAAVTLRDSTCQAEFNGSHFLLVFPVISCGTEVLLLGQPRRVQYKNMVLLWRDDLQAILALNGTENKSRSPLGIHFSCMATVATRPPPADGGDLVHWAPKGPGSHPGLSHLPTPRQRSGPALLLKLFVNENYEQGRTGPCFITANQRVYVEISAKGPSLEVVEVKSCVVSPVSDPKKPGSWPVISDSCSLDPSLTFNAEEEEDDGKLKEGEMEELESGRIYDRDGGVSPQHKTEIKGGETPATMEESSKSIQAEEEIHSFRFSFILRPVYNDSVQFLHCSLRLCVSNSTRGGKPIKETAKTDCQEGIRVPPLVSRSPTHQCEIRNLTRPMVVTQPIRPSAGQRTKRLSVSPAVSPDPEHSSPVMQTAAVMGIVFAAFVIGVSLTGALWCIYSSTGARPTSPGEEFHLTDQTHGICNSWNPPLVSNQSSSSL